MCVNDFPDPKGYSTLTIADVEATCLKKCTPGTTIRGITELVAIMTPAVTLGNDSESGDIAPFSVPHL